MEYFDKHGDLSGELSLSLGMMFYCIYAAEIIAYRMADTMDAFKQKNKLVQNKKQCLNKARKMTQDIIRNLEIAFDDNFSSAAATQSGYMDNIQELANDVLKTLLIYFSRGDGDWEKKDKMKIALLNFKPTPEMEQLDLVGLMKYFKLQ